MIPPQTLPFDLHGLQTYELQGRPSKVFADELGKPISPETTVGDWLDGLPQQLGGNELRGVRDHICRAVTTGKRVAVAIGGHVIKTGCGPYLIDWIQRGIIQSISMNGSAAIHDFELALVGKTSEDVGKQLPLGKFGMAQETADAFAIASRIGAEGYGLGHGLGRHMETLSLRHPEASVVYAAYRAGIPCTIHVAMGTDIVHMHPHVCGAAVGEATMIDFRLLCTVVSQLAGGVWMNLGSAVIMPEVFLKVVSVVRNFGHSLDGMIAVNLDKNSNYRSRVNVTERPAHKGYELIGYHEIMIPLLHVAVASKLLQQAEQESMAAAA
jgi:hypothetical protein